jgi:hypothetical protein
MMLLELLVVLAGLIFAPIINVNSLSTQSNVFFLAIVLSTKESSA